MKIKSLLLLCFIISGCISTNPVKNQIQKGDIEIILQRIDCSGSGYVYMYDNGTINKELNYFDSLLNSNTLSPLMTELIGNHIERTKMIKDSLPFLKNTSMYFMSASDPRVIAFYVKPPNPCPRPGGMCIKGAKSISYFASDSNDSIQVKVDEQALKEAETYYDKTTKIKTVEFQNNIIADSIIELTRMDDQKIVATYTEYVREIPNQ